jgi:hypothetical protein
VKDVYMPLDHYSRKPRGFAFVEFLQASDARYNVIGRFLWTTMLLLLRMSCVVCSCAFDEMDTHVVDGRELRIEFAKQSRKTSAEMRKRFSPPRRDHDNAVNACDRGDRRGGGNVARRDRDRDYSAHDDRLNRDRDRNRDCDQTRDTFRNRHRYRDDDRDRDRDRGRDRHSRSRSRSPVYPSDRRRSRS